MKRRKERAATADILDRINREPEVKQTTMEEDDKTVYELIGAVVGVIILLAAIGGLLGWLALQLSPRLWQILFIN
jgi:hypothetical protein